MVLVVDPADRIGWVVVRLSTVPLVAMCVSVVIVKAGGFAAPATEAGATTIEAIATAANESDVSQERRRECIR